MIKKQKQMIYGQLETMGYYLPKKGHPSVTLNKMLFIKNNPQSCLQMTELIEFKLPVFLPRKVIAKAISETLKNRNITPWFENSTLPPKKYLVKYLHSIDLYSYFFVAGDQQKKLQKPMRAFKKKRKLSAWMKKKQQYQNDLNKSTDNVDAISAVSNDFDYKKECEAIFFTERFRIFVIQEMNETVYDEYFAVPTARLKTIRKTAKITRLIHQLRKFEKNRPV